MTDQSRSEKYLFMHSLKLLTPFLALGAMSYAQNAKLSPDLQALDPNSQVKVIVQYNHVPTPADHQRICGGQCTMGNQLGIVAGGSYSMPGSAVANAAKDASVTHISIDHAIQAHLDYATAATNATIAHTLGATGVGVGVAVIDSGIASNSDFGNRVVLTMDFTGGNGQDAYGHGTHVAGIIGGNGANSHCSTCTRDIAGMAPGVNLLNLRVLDQSGLSSDSTVIQAIDYAISLKKTYNIRVINLSVGRPIFESYTVDPLCQAVEAAWKAGIVVVVAAGNDGRLNFVGNKGYGTINSPGNDPYSLTVGSMKTEDTYDRADDQLASYSSKGPSLYDNVAKPDLVAPGNQIVSVLASSSATLPTLVPGNIVNTNYYNAKGTTAKSPYYMALSGTSMAAAVTSGAVADLLQVQPNLTPDQVKARLMLTAYKSFPYSSVAYDATTGQSYTDYYDAFSRGAGYLDLAAAIQSSAVANGSALSPTVQTIPLFHTLTLQGNLLSAWNLSGMFGSFTPTNVWGSSDLGLGNSVITPEASIVSLVASVTSSPAATSAAWGTSSAWATSAAWGTSAAWATSAVWGTSILAASSTTAATSAVWATSNPVLVGEK